MRTFFTIGFALLFVVTGFAQKDCGTASYTEKAVLADPSIALKRKAVDDFTYNYLHRNWRTEGNDNGTASPIKIVIPVVVHIVYNNGAENISDDQVISQIEALNRDFNKLNDDLVNVPSVFASLSADCEIRFELAKVDPDGRATTGITRKKTTRDLWVDDDKVKSIQTGGADAWDSKSYLNIWVCNLVSSLLGYSSFPGTPGNLDGVVIRNTNFGTRGSASGSFNKGRTAVHEVGHWLNLIHLWGDINCGDDLVDDTPKQRSYNRGCPKFPKISLGCDNTPNGDLFMNYMDFADDACMVMFTDGQKQRMRSLFVDGGFRHDLLSSKALGQPWNFTPAPEVNNELKQGTIHAYPNPAKSSIQIEAAQDVILQGKTYSIYSTTGALLYTGTVTQTRPSIDISRLNQGVYFIMIGQKSDGLITRFVKQ